MSRLITTDGSLLTRWMENGASYVRSRWHAFRDECLHCRECKQRISPFEKVCSHCGASGPAAVSVASIGFLGGACLAAAILLVILL